MQVRCFHCICISPRNSWARDELDNVSNPSRYVPTGINNKIITVNNVFSFCYLLKFAKEAFVNPLVKSNELVSRCLSFRRPCQAKIDVIVKWTERTLCVHAKFETMRFTVRRCQKIAIELNSPVSVVGMRYSLMFLISLLRDMSVVISSRVRTWDMEIFTTRSWASYPLDYSI